MRLADPFKAPQVADTTGTSPRSHRHCPLIPLRDVRPKPVVAVQAQSRHDAVAVLPCGARFVSASDDRTAKLWTVDGALERTFEGGDMVFCVAALPDACTL